MTLAVAVTAVAGAGCSLFADPAGDDDDAPPAEGEGELPGEGEGEAPAEGEGEGDAGEGEGEGDGPPTPGVDLTLDVGGIDPDVTFVDFAPDACEVTQGCVGAAGVRALLGFELVARNVGDTDLFVSGTDPNISAAACGGDALAGFVEWRIVTIDGSVVAQGALDVRPLTSIASLSPAALTLAPCGLVDVTDVPAGDYDLELTIDPAGLFDVDLDNNTVSVDLPLVDMQCDGVACGGACCPGNLCVDGACQLPDLSVDEQVLFDSSRIIERFFGGDSCSVVESCVSGDGNRRLLNFSTTTPNDGNVDLVMGVPNGNPLFTFGECHDHFHFDQYAQYRLLTLDGEVAATGHKQAFCLMDLERRTDDGPPRFDCQDQGISQGWADTYGRHLDCQWVDITGVPEGNYVLEVAVNFARIIPELDYTNNVARVPVFIPGDPNACIPSDEICGNGLDENCDDVPDDNCAPITQNDTCLGALYVGGDGGVFTGEITATNAPETAPSCNAVGGGGELFFNFDVPFQGIVYLSTYGSEIDTTLTIYRDALCADENEEACLDDGCGEAGGGAHFVGALEGGPYTAVVKAKQAGAVGRVQLKIQNAGCGSAQLIDADEVFGDLTGAGDDTAASCVAEGGDGVGPDELWYFTTCPGAHQFLMETCNFFVGTEPGQVDRIDTVIEVLEGACLGAPVDGACNDDTPEQNQAQHRVCSEMNPTLEGQGAGDGLWFVLVDGFDTDDVGRYGIRVVEQ